MQYDDFNPAWQLRMRIAASVGVNVVLIVLAAGCIISSERLSHVVGGGFLVISVPRLLSALTDLITEWPARYERNYVRPAPLGIAVAVQRDQPSDTDASIN